MRSEYHTSHLLCSAILRYSQCKQKEVMTTITMVVQSLTTSFLLGTLLSMPPST